METKTKMSAGTRLGSMILDHVFMCIIAMIFFIPFMIKAFAGAFTISHEETNPFNFNGPLFYISLIGFAVYFCKDSVNGRSIAKRITKLQVVDNVTGKAASPVKCFIRNIFCVIWPVEVIVTLTNPNRRIGDFVAGTRVEFYDAAVAEQAKVPVVKTIISLALAYGLILLLMQSLTALGPVSPSINYIKSSYNESESKALEKLYAEDTLGNFLTASVKVYDSVVGQKLKYISVIYLYKKNYFNYPDKLNELEHQALQLLYTVHPANTFTGKAQYIYKEENLMQSYTMRMGIKGEVLDNR